MDLRKMFEDQGGQVIEKEVIINDELKLMITVFLREDGSLMATETIPQFIGTEEEEEEETVKSLEVRLAEAIEKEDYALASILKEKIWHLKNIEK